MVLNKNKHNSLVKKQISNTCALRKSFLPILHMAKEVVVLSLCAAAVHYVTEVQILCFHFLILFL